jgi:hypothetical protein
MIEVHLVTEIIANVEDDGEGDSQIIIKAIG